MVPSPPPPAHPLRQGVHVHCPARSTNGRARPRRASSGHRSHARPCSPHALVPRSLPRRLTPDREHEELEELSQGQWEGHRRSEVYTPEVIDRMYRVRTFPLPCRFVGLVSLISRMATIFSRPAESPNSKSRIGFLISCKPTFSSHIWRVCRLVLVSTLETSLDLRSTPSLVRTVGVFSHGLTMRCFFRRALNADKPNVWLHTLDNTGVIEMSFLAEHKLWRLDSYNNTTHLVYPEEH